MIKNMPVDDYDQSFETPRKNNHSFTEPRSQVLLGSESLQNQYNNTTHRPYQKLPPPGKYYLCFKIDGESYRAAQCNKSHELTKAIDLIICIGSFDQQCVIIKGLLKSDRLKQHMVKIGVEK